MFLDYFALGLLFFIAITLFYGMIVLHDIPCLTPLKLCHSILSLMTQRGCWSSRDPILAVRPFR